VSSATGSRSAQAIMTAGQQRSDCRKRRGAVVEEVRRSSVLCAVMGRHRCGDRAATPRTKLKTALCGPIPGQQIDRETKPSGTEAKCGRKLNRRTNQAGGQLDRRMRSSDRSVRAKSTGGNRNTPDRKGSRAKDRSAATHIHNQTDTFHSESRVGYQ
jgi:hypothetical protein